MSGRRRLAGDERADVVVIGGGLTGCLAACELRKRKRGVVVLDARTGGAGETRLGHVATGPALLYPHAAGEARERARRQWQWLRDGHDRLRDWLTALGTDCAYRAAGGFLVATSREEAAEMAEAEDALREDTFSSEFLDHYMLESRFDVTGLVAGLWMCDDADLDAGRFLRAVAAEAEARGARLFDDSAALTLEVSARGVTVVTAAGRVEAAEAIVCAGEGTSGLLPSLAHAWSHLGVTAASYAVASPAVPTPGRFLGGRIGWRIDGAVVRATASAPTADLVALGNERDAVLTRHLPAVPGHTGPVGRLSATRDGLPLVGRLGETPVVVAAGYGDDGLAWAPVAAGWAAAAVAGERVPGELSPGRGNPADP